MHSRGPLWDGPRPTSTARSKRGQTTSDAPPRPSQGGRPRDSGYLRVTTVRHVGETMGNRDGDGEPGLLLGERFDGALAWASAVQRDHWRKGTAVPYVSHLMGVATLVLEDGGDEDEAIAALLHDSVEDRQVDPAEIERRFGARVRGVVEECTFVGGDSAARKRRGVAAVAGSSPGALRVKLADKLHNVRSIVRDLENDGPAVWERFNTTRAETLAYYRDLAAAFRQRGGGWMVDEFERAVAELDRLAG